jgi:hypothetical protein
MTGTGRLVGRSRWPLGFIGMIAWIAAGERYVARHDRDFTTIWATSWQRAAQAAAREAPRCDVLCFGDSLVKQGVAPRVIEARLGKKVHNLAVFNGEAPTSYFLFRRALAAGARPSAVLVDGELLEDNPLERTRLWPEVATLRETWELAFAVRDPDFFSAVALAKCVVSIKDRHEIRANVMAAFRGEFPVSHWELFPSLRNWNQNHGAHIVPARDLAEHGDPFPKMLADTNYLPSTWSCNPANGEYVARFLSLAAARRIPVYWLLPPVHPEVQARRERGGRDDIYIAFVRQLAERFPNTVVVDGRRAGFDASSMQDATHLNVKGARAWSSALAEILARPARVGESIDRRWVPLPPFGTRSIAASLEDLEQSGVALRTNAGRATR